MSYEAVIDPQERAQWIWALFFSFMVPEVLTVLKSLQLLIFKSFDKPTTKSFFLVSHRYIDFVEGRPRVFPHLHQAGGGDTTSLGLFSGVLLRRHPHYRTRHSRFRCASRTGRRQRGHVDQLSVHLTGYHVIPVTVYQENQVSHLCTSPRYCSHCFPIIGPIHMAVDGPTRIHLRHLGHSLWYFLDVIRMVGKLHRYRDNIL